MTHFKQVEGRTNSNATCQVTRIPQNQCGGGMLEYVILVSLIAIALIFALNAFSTSISARYSKTGCQIVNDGTQAVGGSEGEPGNTDDCGGAPSVIGGGD